MKNALNGVLILGFVAVDFFFFHDFFKAGESVSVAQYLTGVLSLIVIAMSVWSLFKDNRSVVE